MRGAWLVVAVAVAVGAAALSTSCSSKNPFFCAGSPNGVCPVTDGSNAGSDGGTDGMKGCGSDADCPNPDLPACDVGTGVCGVCSPTNLSQCTGSDAPSCSGSDVCTACFSDMSCPGGAGVCLGTGACAPPNTVLFASQDGAGSACTLASPCSIDVAVSEVTSSMSIVELLPGTYTLSSSGLGLNNNSVWLVGSGATLDASAVSSSAFGGVTAGAPTVRMDFVQVINSTPNGVFCSGSALTLFRVTVKGSTGSTAVGVKSTDCTLAILRSTIAANQGGGLSVDDGTIDIENSFIVLNGNPNAATPGATLQPGAGSNVFRFNTVAYNTIISPSVDSAGVACVTAVNLEESLITANVGGSSQTSAMCGSDSTDIISATDDFDFVRTSGSNFDFHLGSASSPAVNVGSNNGPNCGGIDFDGDKRPQQTFCCIGADEFVPGETPP
jgi:hypothetical protein